MVRLPAEVRRAQLLEAAVRLMSREGPAAATTRAIVAEAGMSLATFHYCFRSREELLREVFAQVTSSVEDGVSPSRAPASPPRGRPAPAAEPPGRPSAAARARAADALRAALTESLTAHLERMDADPGPELLRLELSTLALRDPGLRELAAEQSRRSHESAERLLTVVAERSGLSWRQDPAELARLVVILIDGARISRLADHDSTATRAALAPVIDHLATLADPSTRSR